MSEIKDKLAMRIEARRKQAEAEAAAKAQGGQATPAPVAAPAVPAATPPTAAPVVPVEVEPPAQFPTETKNEFPSETKPNAPDVAAAIQAIAAGDNPIAVARMLSAIIAGGMSRKELTGKIDKSDGWLSKRLGLLKAPKDIQRLIEAGELSESEYYDNRQNVKAGIKGRGETLRYKRMPTVTISFEAAQALASILQDLAAKAGAAPIRLEAKTTKKDLTSVLNQRAGEVWGMLKE